MVSIHVDGQFSKAAIVDFVIANKLPLVTVLSKETGQDLFDNPIKRQVGLTKLKYVIPFPRLILFMSRNCLVIFFCQLLLFAMSNDSKIIMPAFQEAAKLFKGKVGANTALFAVYEC